jgi:hypothetical protein
MTQIFTITTDNHIPSLEGLLILSVIILNVSSGGILGFPKRARETQSTTTHDPEEAPLSKIIIRKKTLPIKIFFIP